ncbi:hypothetical protein ACFYRC_34595 [Streptomyces sp. NPDC005279]|uniref:hypothetical protein n=1 Tax=Streptomyces sp. NPDC005279 TaxID=3364712 RepID=UPI00368B4416
MPRLVLAVKSGTAGELPGKLLDGYRAEPGAATVDLLLCEAHQQQTLLQSGQTGEWNPAPTRRDIRALTVRRPWQATSHKNQVPINEPTRLMNDRG